MTMTIEKTETAFGKEATRLETTPGSSMMDEKAEIVFSSGDGDLASFNKRVKTVETVLETAALDSFFHDNLPEHLRKKLALIEGVLHISEELKGDINLVDLWAKLRLQGITRYKYHPPGEFAEEYAKFAVLQVSDKNEIQKLATDLIARAYASNASDIHIVDNVGYSLVKFRSLGRLREDSQLEAETGRRLIRAICDTLGQSGDSPAWSECERYDGRIVNRDYLPTRVHSVRIHCEPIECQQGSGTFMALRLLFDSTNAQGSLEQRLMALGFTGSAERDEQTGKILAENQCASVRFLTQRTGLTIISGPTGHGKSTALKHIMESMTLESPDRAYHSVEDPPEYPLKGVHQIKVITKQNNQGSEEHAKRAEAYMAAIAGAMRSDPDVLMIGEIRYPEAAVAAIDAALTGHAVWATLHANNGFGIITRLESLLRAANYRDPLDALCDPNVLAGLEYQRLIAKLCPHCKRRWMDLTREERERAIPADVRARLFRVLEASQLEQMCVQGEGCAKCAQQGEQGQTVAAEVIVMDQEMLGMLRKGDMVKAYNHWKNMGGMSYIEHALNLIRQGVVDPVTVERRLGVPLNFNKFFMEQERSLS